MKSKTARFYRNNSPFKAGQIKTAVTQWFLRNSLIATRLYERAQRKKGRMFVLKAKLVKFYEHTVQAKLNSARAGLTRFKRNVTGQVAPLRAKLKAARQQGQVWLARYRRNMWVTAIVGTTVVAGVAMVYWWQRSPAFRATVKPVGVVILSGLVTLGVLLKGLGLRWHEGLMDLSRRLLTLGTGIPAILGRWWHRFTRPVINVVVVPHPTPDSVPVPPLDGRRS